MYKFCNTFVFLLLSQPDLFIQYLEKKYEWDAEQFEVVIIFQVLKVYFMVPKLIWIVKE
jgi:hypothetical protein